MGQFGDTTLTKVFVGGLAWETQKDALREHFDQYGEILEAVIISDKVTGRSKGYGFVTFKEAEAAKKACEEATPMISGRRANCNLASLGARRSSTRSSPTNLHSSGLAVAAPRPVTTPPPASPIPAQWYYPSGPPQPSPFHHYHGMPFYAAAAAAGNYGYSPSYVADLGYNQKLSHTAGGGSYLQGQFAHAPYSGQGGGVVAHNAMLPVYPLYHFHPQSHQTMGIPTHVFPPAAASPITNIPTTFISKPTAMPPTTVEQVTGCS